MINKENIEDFKVQLFEILENTGNDIPAKIKKASRIVRIFLPILIIFNILAVIAGSFNDIPIWIKQSLPGFEVFSVIIFTIEYVLRLWTANVDKNYKKSKHPHSEYFKSGMAIIDLIAILPFYISIIVNLIVKLLFMVNLPFMINVDFRFLRVFRLFRLLRVFKLSRHIHPMRDIGDVLKEQKWKLLSAIVIIVILLLLASGAMYYIENTDQPDKFPNIIATFWWAVATLTTVGYGDVYPITVWGKFLGGLIAIMGIATIGIPTAIITDGFADVIRKKKEEKEKKKNSNKKDTTAQNFTEIETKNRKAFLELMEEWSKSLADKEDDEKRKGELLIGLVKSFNPFPELKTDAALSPELDSSKQSSEGQDDLPRYWHFAMYDAETQIKVLENDNDKGETVLALFESGTSWRSDYVRQVKPGDVIFLFKRGGGGYIGAFKAKRTKVIDYNDDYDFESDHPEDDYDKRYDMYNSLRDGDADYAACIIVSPLAFNYKGVSCLTVRRKTIEPFTDPKGEAVKYLLTRFSGKGLSEERNAGMNKFENSKTVTIQEDDKAFFKKLAGPALIAKEIQIRDKLESELNFKDHWYESTVHKKINEDISLGYYYGNGIMQLGIVSTKTNKDLVNKDKFRQLLCQKEFCDGFDDISSDDPAWECKTITKKGLIDEIFAFLKEKYALLEVEVTKILKVG
ncbi:MAG: ion transporter [Bacteroidales bacterium]|jgi:voltage-gated potassium channel|nr:ion transporter [Bacteroidales bacterium]